MITKQIMDFFGPCNNDVIMIILKLMTSKEIHILSLVNKYMNHIFNTDQSIWEHHMINETNTSIQKSTYHDNNMDSYKTYKNNKYNFYANHTRNNIFSHDEIDRIKKISVPKMNRIIDMHLNYITFTFSNNTGCRLILNNLIIEGVLLDSHVVRHGLRINECYVVEDIEYDNVDIIRHIYKLKNDMLPTFLNIPYYYVSLNDGVIFSVFIEFKPECVLSEEMYQKLYIDVDAYKIDQINQVQRIPKFFYKKIYNYPYMIHLNNYNHASIIKKQIRIKQNDIHAMSTIIICPYKCKIVSFTVITRNSVTNIGYLLIKSEYCEIYNGMYIIDFEKYGYIYSGLYLLKYIVIHIELQNDSDELYDETKDIYIGLSVKTISWISQ
jgi:hypothetical protein